MGYIKNIYLNTRGQELGMFGNFMLPTTFRDQSQKWKRLTMVHVSNAILVVHDFIFQAIRATCPDDKVRSRLFQLLIDDFLDCSRCAINYAESILHNECGGKTNTCNPQFAELLGQTRRKHQQSTAAKATGGKSFSEKSVIWIQKRDVETAIFQTLKDVDGIRRDIYQQVIDYFLLNSETGALRVLTPKRIMSMTSEQLKSIAEEDPASKRARERLQHEIASLEAAVAVLRS
ncbi:hypothetical protein GGS26DRAFT_592808 [Hypomontagnella submonticulosa]|nr:hypothetical protein GGS26DRAFT_592808 [Hypomontagnella submonticulosa]